jgi:hypothetical protein
MSLLGIGLSVVGLGSGGLLAGIAKFGARKVFGKIGSAARAGADKAKAVDWGKVYRTVALLGLPLLIFLAVYEWSEARHAGKQLGAEQKRVAGLVRVNAAEVAAHLVTKQSLADALDKIDDTNRRIAAAGADLERSKQEAAANEARLAGQFKVTKATIDTLRDDAARKDRVPCKVSPAAAKALEGL